MKILQKKSGVKGIVAAVSVAAAILALLLIFSTVFTKNTVEYNAELSDLYAMRNAELAALLIDYTDELKDGGYWFDPDTNALIPDSEEQPSTGGLGTGRRGRSQAAFYNSTGSVYEYDEEEDYRDKVIHVTIAGKDDIIVEWVPRT